LSGVQCIMVNTVYFHCCCNRVHGETLNRKINTKRREQTGNIQKVFFKKKPLPFNDLFPFPPLAGRLPYLAPLRSPFLAYSRPPQPAVHSSTHPLHCLLLAPLVRIARDNLNLVGENARRIFLGELESDVLNQEGPDLVAETICVQVTLNSHITDYRQARID